MKGGACQGFIDRKTICIGKGVIFGVWGYKIQKKNETERFEIESHFLTNEKGAGIIMLIYKRIGCQKKRVFGFEAICFRPFSRGGKMKQWGE